jgi:hypothetical protein
MLFRTSSNDFKKIAYQTSDVGATGTGDNPTGLSLVNKPHERDFSSPKNE